MRLPQEIQDFINAPDTVDFVTRATDAFFDFVKESGEVIIGQILSGRYVLGYIKEEKMCIRDSISSSPLFSCTVAWRQSDRPYLQ